MSAGVNKVENKAEEERKEVEMGPEVALKEEKEITEADEKKPVKKEKKEARVNQPVFRNQR